MSLDLLEWTPAAARTVRRSRRALDMAKKRSGWERRKDRVARGLPPYTPGEAVSRKARDRRRHLESQRAMVKRIAEYKLAHGCVDCGYNAHAMALELDHLPGFEKSTTISRMAVSVRSWARIEEEIAKCEVVCANCHRIRTARRLADGGSQGIHAIEMREEQVRLRAEVTRLGLVLRDALDELEHDHRHAALAILRAVVS